MLRRFHNSHPSGVGRQDDDEAPQEQEGEQCSPCRKRTLKSAAQQRVPTEVLVRTRAVACKVNDPSRNVAHRT